MRRGTCVWVALLALVSLVATAGPVSASPTGGDTYVPAARGGYQDPDSPDSSSSESKKKKQDPCPQKLWTIALPIEGLACILLLPNPERTDEEEKEKEESSSVIG